MFYRKLFNRNTAKSYIWIGFFALIAILPLFAGETRYVPLLVSIGMNLIIALGLVVLFGYSGQLSLGHATFVGVSAYITAYLSTALHVPTILSLLAGIIGALLVGIIVSPILRLKRFYFTISTIALNLVFFSLVKGLPLTGRSMGINGVPPLSLGIITFNIILDYYYLVWALVALSMWITANVINSQFGRGLRVLSQDDASAQVVGINVTYSKIKAFLFSVALAGLSGGIGAHYLRLVVPDMFTFSYSIGYVIMAIIGGVQSVWGALLGSMLITYISEAFQVFIRFRDIFYGLALIIVLIYIPSGLIGIFQFLPARFRLSTSIADSNPVKGKNPTRKELISLKQQNNVEPVLEVEGLSKSFGGVQAVSDLSFSVRCGQIKGILGPNGSGKTTIFNLISGLITPDRGKIVFKGQDITRHPPHVVARQGIARTFQVIRPVVGLSVFESTLVGWERWFKVGFSDIMINSPKMRRQEAEARRCASENIELVGLKGAEAKMFDKLPIGQRKLNQIAQALTFDPELLLLDEPAGGLNDTEIENLAELLSALVKRGVCIVLVEHNVNLVMNICDEILVLDFGEKIAEGTPEEIRSNPKVQAAYLGE